MGSRVFVILLGDVSCALTLLFKVSLDGGPLLDGNGKPRRPRVKATGDEENEDLPPGVIGVGKRGRYNKDGQLVERRQKISPANFAAQSHLMNGALPAEPICACIDESKPAIRPLRWL